MTTVSSNLTQDAPAADRTGCGTVVVSSALRVLFMDREAIGLVGRLDPGFPVGPNTTPLPSCLTQVAQEISAVRPSQSSTERSSRAQVHRLVGPPSDPIRVQGFLIPRPHAQEDWVVLLLSGTDRRAERSTKSWSSAGAMRGLTDGWGA